MTLIELAEAAEALGAGGGVLLTAEEARDIVEACREHGERADGLRAENHRLRGQNARLERLLRTRAVPADAYLERRTVAAQ